MNVRLITNDAEYHEVVRIIGLLMGKGEAISNADGALLEAWSKLDSDYEHRTSEPIVHPDPMSFIEYLMDHRGIGAADLVPDVSATLEEAEQTLTSVHAIDEETVRKLGTMLGVPPELFLKRARR